MMFFMAMVPSYLVATRAGMPVSICLELFFRCRTQVNHYACPSSFRLLAAAPYITLRVSHARSRSSRIRIGALTSTLRVRRGERVQVCLGQTANW